MLSHGLPSCSCAVAPAQTPWGRIGTDQKEGVCCGQVAGAKQRALMAYYKSVAGSGPEKLPGGGGAVCILLDVVLLLLLVLLLVLSCSGG